MRSARNRLKVSGLTVLLCMSAQPAVGQDVFELRQLAPGVYAAEVLRQPSAYAFANSLVIVGADGVLVVDTQQSLSAANSLIAEIGRLTSAPVRWVVNTHWHGDHVNGNQAYRDAFPHVEFIAHESLGEDLQKLGSPRRQLELAELPVSIEQRRHWLRDGRGPGGAALSDADRRSIEHSLALRQAYYAELNVIKPPEPTIAFSSQLDLMLGEHHIQLIHVGPAHTRGDIIVHVPALGIVAVGDLVELGMPYFDDAYPAGWLRAIQTIAALKPVMLVPSHGRVVRDFSALHDMEQLLSGIVRQAGLPSGQEVDDQLADWEPLEKHWNGRYGVSAAAFRAAVLTAIARARQERAVQ